MTNIEILTAIGFSITLNHGINSDKWAIFNNEVPVTFNDDTKIKKIIQELLANAFCCGKLEGYDVMYCGDPMRMDDSKAQIWDKFDEIMEKHYIK